MTIARSLSGRALLFLLPALLCSCASYTSETKAIRSDFRAGQYAGALKALEDSDLKDQTRNRLLYQMEKSSIVERLGRRKEARALLLKADRTVDELYRSSLSGDVASFVYNDSAMDYQGEDYEKVAIHTMLALSFLKDDELKKARVEARRINTRLTEINNFYKENKNRYAEDAFARYLAGAIYESLGEWDSAIIEYRAALRVYQGAYSRYFDTAVPGHLVDALHALYRKRGRTAEAAKLSRAHKIKTRPAGYGDLIVLHSLDSITVKTTGEFVMMWDGKPLRFSFPVIRRRARSWYGRTGVRVDGRAGFHTGEMVQNMDAIASGTLEDSRARIMVKMASRLVLKDQLAQQAKQNLGGLGELAVGIYGAVTETADTRSWTLLPAAIYMTRLSLPAGKHGIRVVSNGRVSGVRQVRVTPGSIRFLTAWR